jgi:Tfp pilus assembly protein PilN
MISINFASRNYRAYERFIAAIAAATVLLALTAVGMAWTAASLRTEYADLGKKIAAAEQDAASVNSSLEERDRIETSLKEMSGVLESRRFSWTRFFTGLETVVPIGVAMKKVDFDPKGRSVSLEGTAQSPEALRNLVVALEKSKAFSTPYLKHQSLEKGSISFNVVALYNESRSAIGVVQDKR